MYDRTTRTGLLAALVLLAPKMLPAEPAVPEMVITSTRVERDVFNTSQAVSVINDKQVEEANVTSTPDLFRHVEGVSIQKTNQGGGSPFIRGLTGKQILLLVDGMRLNNSFYRFGPHQYLNTIDPNSIERIEVVRGPGSVLYGSDALGGVINIITKKRTEFLESLAVDGQLSATYDSAAAGTSYEDEIGGYALRLQSEGNWNDLGWVWGGSTKSDDDLNGGDELGDQVPGGYRQYAGDIKLNRQFEPGTELIGGLQYLRQDDVPKTSEVTLDGKVKFNYAPQERLFTYLEYRDKNLAWFEDVQFNLSYNRQREGEEIIARLPTETRELTEVGTIGTTLKLTHALFDHHRLTYGMEFYHDDYDTRKQSEDLSTGIVMALKPGVPDRAVYDNLGFFIQDEFDLGEDATLIVGGRYSRFFASGQLDHPSEGRKSLSLEADQITGSLQAVYSVTPELNLMANLSQGFRAPNMEDFFGRVDFNTEIPNTDLKPEESVNYEIGLKYLTSSVFADLYYFYADYDNLIDRVDTVDSFNQPVKQRRNINQAVIQGVEGGVRYQINPDWLITASFSWTQGRDDKDKPLRRIPPLNGSLQLRYIHNHRFWMELSTVLAKNQDELSGGDQSDLRIPDGGTPGYAVFSIRSGFRRTRHEQLLVTFENLFDEKYKAHGSGIYAAGRSVVVSYSVKF